LIGEAAGLACAAAWAVIGLIMRGVATHVDPVLVNGLRCLFAVLTLFALAVISGHAGASFTSSAVASIVLSGLLGQAIGDAAFVDAARRIGASRAMPISAASPLLTVALAAVLLGERLTTLAVVGTFLVLGGVYLLAFPFGSSKSAVALMSAADRRGVLMALLAALCWSVSTIILRQALVGIDLVAANLVRLSTAAVMLLGLHAARSGPHLPATFTRRTLAIMLVAGVLSSFSSLMYLTSVHYAGAAKASVLNATSPLFGLPLSLVILKERITRRIVFGTLLSVAGIWLVVGQ
jgi:drug/metabolite transporter (DMT)-like permease